MDREHVEAELPGDRWVLARSLLVIAAVMALVWPAFAVYGAWRGGATGLLVSLGAAFLCGIGAGVSLMVGIAAQRSSKPVTGILGGMLIRMVVPLVALLAIPQMNAQLAGCGAQEILLGYYLVALAVETWLFVRLIPAHSAGVAKAT